MAKTFNEYQKSEVRRAVYNALAEISRELDASKEDMDQAIEWFQIKFYEDECEE